MSLPKDDAAVLSARWTEGVLLKRDVFSTVERGRFRDDCRRSRRRAAPARSGAVVVLSRWPAICSAASAARWRWRAISTSGRNCCGPASRRWCAASSTAWRCIWPSRMATLAYFRSAKLALRKLHRAGICHNDLAKEQNWLRGSDGRAYVTDFQLAACFKSRSTLFRIAAYEDLRHLLKHKRSYAPEALTPTERKILARKSAVASIWLMTGKKVYRAITRGLFNFTDREGGGRRLVNDAPVLIELIRKNPEVRDTAIVAFADRRTGVGLYAFVEADQPALEAQLRSELAAAKGAKAAGAYPGGAGAAARRRRQTAHRDPAARRDEPARSDRADDDERRRPRVPEGHSGVAEEFAGPVQFRGGELDARSPSSVVTCEARTQQSSARDIDRGDWMLRFARMTAASDLPAELPRPRRPPQRPQRPQPRRRLRHERIVVRARHPLQIAADQRQRQEYRPHLRRHIGQQRRTPSSNALAPRRSADPAPRAASASPCRQTPLPSRCRAAAAIAAARTAGAATASSGSAAITWAMPCARPAWRARCSISSDWRPQIAAPSENSAHDGIVDVAFQRRHGRHRIVVEIELMLVDQPRQPLDRQAAVRGSPATVRPRPDCPRRRHGRRPPACRSTIAAAFRRAAAG